jgi:hypothetical protein
MRRSLFNVITVAAGAVLVAAVGVSAHAQISSTLTRVGVLSQTATSHTEKGEVATGARDAEPTEVPEQENPTPEPTEKPEAPEAQDNDADDNDNETQDTSGDQGDNHSDTGDQSGDGHDGGGD